MRKETYVLDNLQLVRVDTRQARSLHMSKHTIWTAPANMNLNSELGRMLTFPIYPSDSFEQKSNEISYYNCSKECGLYLKYFTEKEVV